MRTLEFALAESVVALMREAPERCTIAACGTEKHIAQRCSSRRSF